MFEGRLIYSILITGISVLHNIIQRINWGDKLECRPQVMTMQYIAGVPILIINASVVYVHDDGTNTILKESPENSIGVSKP